MHNADKGSTSEKLARCFKSTPVTSILAQTDEPLTRQHGGQEVGAGFLF